MKSRLSYALAACAASLTLSACSSSPTVDPQSSPSQISTEATTEPSLQEWGDWVELTDSAVLSGAVDDRAIFSPSDGSTPYVVDSAGQQVWEFPSGVFSEEGLFTDYYDDERVYVLLRDSNELVALSWENGEELWRADPTDHSLCTTGEGYRLLPGGGDRTNRRLAPDQPLILAWTSTYSDSELGLPAACEEPPNAETPESPVVLGIDPQTGSLMWDMPGYPMLYAYQDFASDMTARFVYMLWNLRGEIMFSRINVLNGEHDEIGTRVIPPNVDYPNYGTLINSGPDQFIVQFNYDYTQEVTVTDWSAGDAGLTMKDTRDADIWSRMLNRTAAGVGYRLALPEAPGENYIASLMATPAHRPIAAPKEWTQPAPDLLDAGEVPNRLYIGDPNIVDADPNEPLVVLPHANGGIGAFKLSDGTEVWKTAGSKPGRTPSYSQVAGQVSYLDGDDVVSVDAHTGEELDRVTVPGAFSVSSYGKFQVIENRTDGVNLLRTLKS